MSNTFFCFSGDITDALETDCKKCSEKQLQGVRKVFRFLFDEHRNYYDELKQKYDPENKYIQKYGEHFEKEGTDLQFS